MTFIQPEFLWFFLLLFVAYWAIPGRAPKNLLLVLASMVFYGWVHPWFLYLLGFSAIVDYSSALGMVRYPDRKKVFLGISLLGNLGLLGFFKYWDFFIENWQFALNQIGLRTSLTTLELFLPVGISFYTFQTLSYTIDVYKGHLAPRKNFLDYATFIMMFPHLVAGPVVRAVDMLPQVEAERTLTPERFRSGLTLALWGAAKKVMIADTISLYVGKAYALRDPSFALIWVAALAFAVQILADFSGYTDIARGTARMLGFELTVNFKHPYLATNPSEFWKRWHVSFSSWIHDYLYKPLLALSRGRRNVATYGSLMLSGLWHGASWNYVLWGVYHATLLTAYRWIQPKIPSTLKEKSWSTPAAVALMFTFTVIGWMIFRETRIDRLAHYFTLTPSFGDTDQAYATAILLAVIAFTAAPLLAGLAVERWVLPRLREEWIPAAQASTWAVCAAIVLVFARDTAQDFIYFQF